MIAKLIFTDISYSWEVMLALALAGFVFGFILKSGIIRKQRKRILSLEDEMLTNHSRILSLEKRIADYKSEKNNTHQDFELITHKAKDQNLKVS